jgi:archaellum component FlaC
MNSGDDTKIQAMADRSADILDTIPKMAALLQPDEKQKYEAYLNGWKEKLEAATKQ